MTATEADDDLTFYTTDRVAEMFDVTPATVRIWCSSGQLKSFKVGRHHRIRKVHLIEFANTKEN